MWTSTRRLLGNQKVKIAVVALGRVLAWKAFNSNLGRLLLMFCHHSPAFRCRRHQLVPERSEAVYVFWFQSINSTLDSQVSDLKDGKVNFPARARTLEIGTDHQLVVLVGLCSVQPDFRGETGNHTS